MAVLFGDPVRPDRRTYRKTYMQTPPVDHGSTVMGQPSWVNHGATQPIPASPVGDTDIASHLEAYAGATGDINLHGFDQNSWDIQI